MQDFKLIDSTYSPNEAREVLSRLVKDKIKFLSQEIFSIQVRFGGDTSHLEKRRSELCVIEQELLQPLESLSNDDHEIVIDCQVNFRIKEKSNSAQSSSSQMAAEIA